MCSKYFIGYIQAGRAKLLFHNFCRNHILIVESHFRISIEDEMWFHISIKFGKEILIRKPLIEGSK